MSCVEHGRKDLGWIKRTFDVDDKYRRNVTDSSIDK